MSCENSNARLQIKYTTIAGQVPSIPSTNDHNDGTWNPTDIYVGEFFLNAIDDKLWVRTIDGLLPMGASGASGSFIGDFVSKANGGTYSGTVFAPTFSAINMIATIISATAIGATIFGSSASTYYGDGSNLTGITTVWNGGTVSNPSQFDNTVDFNQDVSVNDIYSGTLGYIDIHSDVTISGGLSASYFIGDGSLITNLPLGPTANYYTTNAYLDGNIVRYDRTDLADAYSVDLTPILMTYSVAAFNWDSGTNAATILINDGSFFTINLNAFNDISTGVINATDVYANNFYGNFIGPSLNGVISTTYEDLVISASNSTLLPGNWYNFSYTLSGDISDPFPIDINYNIFLFAVTNNALDLTSGKRAMPTPIYGATVQDWYDDFTYNTSDRVIFCNRVWNNILSGTGSIAGVYNLDTTHWEVETNPAYFETIIYDISYSLIDKQITHQRDAFGNEIYGEGQTIGNLLSPQNTIDISDWHNNIREYNDTYKSNNFSRGMWNNICRGLYFPTSLHSNNVQGLIYGNRCAEINHNTILSGPIRNNSLNTASIYDNRAMEIRDNNNTNAIFSNNIIGGIKNNTVSGVITENYNSGDIAYNDTLAIYNNSNNGDIQYNTLNGNISSNNNNGSIEQNTSALDGSIYNNSNSGNIAYNFVDASISFNTNSGYITDNTTQGSIYHNSGSGNIETNTMISSIEYNNTGDIAGNNVTYIAFNSGGGTITLNNTTGAISHNTINTTIDTNSNTGAIQWNTVDSITNNSSNIVDIIQNRGNLIFNNTNIGSITNNQATEIGENNNTGDIVFNDMRGVISANTNTSSIDYNSGLSISTNSNGGSISTNKLSGDIYLNTNGGGITKNVAHLIQGNSNGSSIYDNIVADAIQSNSITGAIYGNKGANISSNNGSGSIYENDIKENISTNSLSGGGTINGNIALTIVSNDIRNSGAISRNNIIGGIFSNIVSSISYNTECEDNISSNNNQFTYINNNSASEITHNTNNGIQRNTVRGKISYNLVSIGAIEDNQCASIENNG